ncbi:MAG TPA: hypothetical protein VNQ77_14010 [Frankiaceae bacterium]|nr:hypothetical protein [Frankiaceae bacterium]
MRALVALAALPLLAPGAARAAAGPAEPMTTCSFGSVTNPFANDRQVAYLGDAAVVFDEGQDPRTGRVTCALRRGDDHTGALLAAVTSLTTPGVAVAPGRVVEYAIGPIDPFALCLSVEIDGAGTFYWDGIAESWSASPLVTCVDWYPDDPVLALLEEVVDPAVCAAPHDEDLYVADERVWDCPPSGGTP